MVPSFFSLDRPTVLLECYGCGVKVNDVISEISLLNNRGRRGAKVVGSSRQSSSSFRCDTRPSIDEKFRRLSVILDGLVDPRLSSGGSMWQILGRPRTIVARCSMTMNRNYCMERIFKPDPWYPWWISMSPMHCFSSISAASAQERAAIFFSFVARLANIW